MNQNRLDDQFAPQEGRENPSLPRENSKENPWEAPAGDPAARTVQETSGFEANGNAPLPQQATPYGYVPQKPPKKHRFLKGLAVAAAVCLLLAAGIAGGLFLSKDLPFGAPETPPTEETNEDAGPSVPNGVLQDRDPVFVPDDSPSDTMNTKEIYANNVNSIVGITVEGEVYNIFGSVSPYASSGTGFILREDGYILTNYHVIEGDELDNPKITVTLYNTETYEAKVIGYDEYSDVALIKIDATGLDPIALGNSDQLVAGENVAIIGHPLGELTYSISKGIVAAVNREISVEDTTLEMFQIDAAVNSGNSGGPAFNEKGQVVGIVTSKYASSSIEGLGFCIPINNAVKIANDLINYGFVRGQAGFGITVKTVYSGNGYYQQALGLQIQSVNKGSCSEKAGLVKGDIILAVDKKSVTSTSQLASIRSTYRAGDTATLTVYRDGEKISVEITFDEYVPETINQAPSIA